MGSGNVLLTPAHPIVGHPPHYLHELPLEDEERLEKIFKSLDVDGNGKIDISDLSNALKEFGVHQKYAEVRHQGLDFISFSLHTLCIGPRPTPRYKLLYCPPPLQPPGLPNNFTRVSSLNLIFGQFGLCTLNILGPIL